MEIKQLLILLFHLCEQSGEIKDQEVLAQDLVKSQSRHVKENASVERKNLVTRRAGRRSLEKSTEKTTALVCQKMIAVVQKILQRLTLETLPQTRENVVWTN